VKEEIPFSNKYSSCHIGQVLTIRNKEIYKLDQFVKWSELLEESIPFFLDFGSKAGKVPKCKGCKRELKNYKEIRVKAR
jgi:hypothetical protein